MIFSPDAYYFALLPVIRDVAAAAESPRSRGPGHVDR